MARSTDYPIIRFLAGAFSLLAVVCLVGGLVCGAYLWIRAEALSGGVILSGPLPQALNQFNATELGWAALFVAIGGGLAFLTFGAVGQFLTMQRDRTINAEHQVQLLEDLLELSEEASDSRQTIRVSLCEGCGRLGSLHRIDSGQWICRECRRQIRSAG